MLHRLTQSHDRHSKPIEDAPIYLRPVAAEAASRCMQGRGGAGRGGVPACGRSRRGRRSRSRAPSSAVDPMTSNGVQ